MKTKWTILIVAGAILMLLSGQVLAQPWGVGGGRGQRIARGQEMQPPEAPVRARAWRPVGVNRRGQGTWCPLGLGPLGVNGLFSPRLGLTDDQVQKIRAILDKARSEVMASIREVLTDEQARQLRQMRSQVAQPAGGMRGPGPQDGFGGPVGRRSQKGMGQGAQVGPRGRRPAGQRSAGGRGTGQDQLLRRRLNQPEAAAVPPAQGQDPNLGQVRNRNVAPIEQVFDRADTNRDGALTKEELRAFREKTRPAR